MGQVVSIAEANRISAIIEYLDAVEKAREWDKRKKDLDALIKSWIPSGETITIGNYNVRVNVTETHGLDTKTLKKELPELWTEYPSVGTRSTLVIA